MSPFLIHTCTGDLMVYGNNLEIYSIINALLESGFPPYKILHARPNSATPCSTNPVVQDCLNVGVKDSGVKTWTDLTLKGWEVDERGRLIGVRLIPNQDRASSGMERKEGEGEEGRKENKDYTVSCQALVYMDQKHVDMQGFKGRQATLVFFMHI